MRRNWFIVGLIFATFFVISFVTNILGALNPDVISSFKLNFKLAGLLPFAFFIAYGVMSVPAGMLVERFKEKAVMLAAFVLALAGGMLFSLLPSYPVFLVSLFLIGAGMAMLQVAINPLLRVAGGEQHFAFNSVMAQLVFGGASFLSPMVFSYLVRNLHGGGNALVTALSRVVPAALPWTALYWLFAALFALMAVLIAFSRFPAVQRKEDESAGSWATHLGLLRQKTVLLFFAGVFCYVGTEQGVSYWMSKFLSDYHGFDPQTVGAAAVGRFWGLMSVGCLLGLLLLKLFDSRKILAGASLCALTLLSLALFGPARVSLVAFPAVGFALSVMWSIIFALALNSVPRQHGSFAGILCTAIIGGAVVQLFIGWLGDLLGLRAGMLLIYVTLGYVLGIGFWARPIIANETIFSKKEHAAPAAA